MASYIKKQWMGWNPSQSEINGNPDLLLRMDNLTLDKEGAVVLARGTQDIYQFTYGPHTIFSKYLGSTKYQFAALNDGSVRVIKGSVDEIETLLTNGSADRAAFHPAYGHVLIFSGDRRCKYDGTTLTDLTPGGPELAPTVREAAKADFVFYNQDFSQFTLVTGSDLVNDSNFARWTTTDTNGTVQLFASPEWNTMNFIEGREGSVDDVFWFFIKITEKEKISKIRVVFGLDDTFDPLENYYYHEWTADDITGEWTNLQCRRGEFTKLGADGNKSWSAVKGFQIIIETTGSTTIEILENGMFFTNYTSGPLNGVYEYAQVNVNNTEAYQAKSKLGPASPFVTLVNGGALVTPETPTDPQVNEIWIYRRDANYRLDVRPIEAAPVLREWYRVKVLNTDTGFGEFKDELSDYDALTLNETYPIVFESITEFTPDHILDAVGLVGDRMIYMSNRDIYFSFHRDPGLYNPLQTVRLSGDTTEKNLWIRKVGINVVLVGTTEDIYVLQGTFLNFPDGSIDVTIRPIGAGEFPPISRTAVVENNAVYYIASDGIRVTGGNGNQKISQYLDELFKGETCHGIPPIQVIPNDNGVYGLAISRGCLWFSAATEADQDGRRLFVYNFNRQYWRYATVTAQVFFHEEDDKLLGGWSSGLGGWLRYVDEVFSSPTNIVFWTPYDDFGAPHNRKDTFNLKVVADAGGSELLIGIAAEGLGFANLGSYSFTGMQERVFKIDDYALNKRYAVSIEGLALTTAKIYGIAFEYEPRPPQHSVLRLQYSNYGIPAPKRIRTQPFILDCLGNEVSITPFLDGSSAPSSTHNSTRKQTLYHYFTTNIEPTDIEYILETADGGVFELYEMGKPEIVEALPVPRKFDQFGPFDIHRLGTLLGIRALLEPTGASLPYSLYGDDDLIYSGALVTEPNKLRVFEDWLLPKTLLGTVIKLEIGPTEDIFYRYWVEFKFNKSGADTDNIVVRIPSA